EPETRSLHRELLAEGAPEPAVGPDRAEPAHPPSATTSAPAARHNLPWQPTSFIGRRRELDELDHVLDGHRLVTLTGPGGCGKTRLAFEVARRRLDRYAGGAWAIELAGIAEDGLVGQAAATALGLDLDPGEPAEVGL